MEEKYHLYAKTLKEAIILRYPMIQVYCKPVIVTAEDFKNCSMALKTNPKNPPPSIDDFRPEMRLGAFEVQIYRKKGDEKKTEVLHSKLNTRRWPNINAILSKICIL